MLSVVLLLLIPAVAARRVGDTRPSGVPGARFVAPPIQVAVLAIYAALLLTTLVQLAFTAPFIRRRPVPALATATALACLAIAYALGLTLTLAAWTVNDAGYEVIRNGPYVRISTAGDLFPQWADALVFVAVALVLRDRFVTHDHAKAPRPLVPLGALMGAAGVFTGLMVLLPSVSTAVYGAALAQRYKGVLGARAYSARLAIANGFFWAHVAVYILGTAFLAFFAVVVKKRAPGDAISQRALTQLIPLLAARALVRLILVIVQAEVRPGSGTPLMAIYAINFVSVLLYGALYAAALGVVGAWLAGRGLWERGDPQGQYGQHPHPEQNTQRYKTGVQPPAQFPGQWGNTGQPVMSMPVPMQVYVGGVYPGQYPGGAFPPGPGGAYPGQQPQNNSAYTALQSPDGPYMGQQPQNTPYTGPQSPDGPYTGQQPQNTPYTGPQSPDGPYTAQQPQNTPYTGPQSQDGLYTAQQPQNTAYTGLQSPNGAYTAPPGQHANVAPSQNPADISPAQHLTDVAPAPVVQQQQQQPAP